MQKNLFPPRTTWLGARFLALGSNSSGCDREKQGARLGRAALVAVECGVPPFAGVVTVHTNIALVDYVEGGVALGLCCQGQEFQLGRTTCTDRVLLAFHANAAVSSGCSRVSGDTVISRNLRGALQTLSIEPALIFQYFDLFPTRIT